MAPWSNCLGSGPKAPSKCKTPNWLRRGEKVQFKRDSRLLPLAVSNPGSAVKCQISDHLYHNTNPLGWEAPQSQTGWTPNPALTPVFRATILQSCDRYYAEVKAPTTVDKQGSPK